MKDFDLNQILEAINIISKFDSKKTKNIEAHVVTRRREGGLQHVSENGKKNLGNGKADSSAFLRRVLRSI